MLIAGVVAITGVLLLSGLEKTSDNPDMWFLDDSFELAIAKNQVLSCGAYGEMKQRFTDGQTQQFGTKITTTFNVFKLDILSLRAGKSIDTIDVNLNGFCDKVNGITSAKLVGGTITTKVYFRDDTGAKILVKTDTKAIATVERDFTMPKALPATIIKISDLKSKISTTKPQITGPLTFEITANLKLKTNLGTHDGTFNLSLGDWIKVTNDKVVNPSPTTQTSQATTNARMELTKIVWNGLVTSEIIFEPGRATHTISVRAELERWTQQEGVPYLVILDPNGKILYSKIPMTSSIKKAVINGKESADTYEFTASNIIIQKVAGKYEIQLHSANDIRKSGSGKPLIAVKEFAVKVNQATTSPTPTSAPTTTVETSKGSLVDGLFKCEIIFDGGKENCIVGETPTFPVSFPDIPASLIRESDPAQKTLVEFWVEPILYFKSGRVDSISNMRLQQDFNIYVNGEDVGTINANSATIGRVNGQYLTISRVSMLATAIESQIQKNGITLQNGDTVKVELKVDGTFDTIINGKKMKGVLQNMIFEYNMIYQQKGNLSCPDGQVRENNICVPNTLGTGSAGTCEGLTGEECANQGKNGGLDSGSGSDFGGIGGIGSDLIDIISGGSGSGGLQEKEKPSGTGGTNGICDKDVDDCAGLVDAIGGQATFFIIIAFMVMIFIIIMIVVIVSLGKNRR